MSIKTKIIVLVLILAAATAGAIYWFLGTAKNKQAQEIVIHDFNEFSSPDFGFSFEYPSNLNLQEFDDENGHMILGNSFQIFITPFDENGPITPERIKKDLPNAVVENPTPVKVAGAQALSFVGAGDGFKTAEVWFVWPPAPYPNGNYLYQITSRLEDAALIENILKTWRFQ